MTDEPLLPFRSGLYNLSMARPQVELIPCWIENMMDRTDSLVFAAPIFFHIVRYFWTV